MSLEVIIAIVIVVAVVIILVPAFFFARKRSPRVNPVHNDATSRYAAPDAQVQPGYDPDGLVNSPDEYGPRGRRAPFFGRRNVGSR